MKANKNTYLDFITSELKKGNSERGKVLSIFVKKWRKSDRTFDRYWKQANDKFSEYQKTLQNKKSEVSIQKEVEAVENGLETKIQRLFSLQKRKNDIEKMLSTGTYLEHKFSGNKVVKAERPLTPQEVSSLTKTFQLLSSEISKIEGDYAETKMKHSGDAENPIMSKVEIEVIHSGTKIAKSEQDVDV